MRTSFDHFQTLETCPHGIYEVSRRSGKGTVKNAKNGGVFSKEGGVNAL